MHRIRILAAVMTFAAVHAAYADDQKPERKPEVRVLELSSERPNPAAERKPAPGQPANPQPAAGAAAWGGGKSMAEWYIERTDKIVGLSDEQKQKIKVEYESRDKATKEFQTSIEAKAKTVTTEMTEAFKSQDKDAIAKSQKAYQELYAPLYELTKKSEAALQNILTAEQRTKLSDNQFASMLESLVPNVELSEAQRREIRAGYGQPAGEYEINGRKLPELIDKTLTADQIAAVLKHRANLYVSMLIANTKLSPEQQQKVDEKLAELTRDHKKTVNLDYTVYQKLSEHVNGLLTAEQKEAMKAQRVFLGGAGGAVGGAGGVQVQPAPGGAILRANPAPNPAANPVERKPAEPRAGEAAQSNVKVTQIPGGGIQVTIGEGGEAREGNAPQQRLQVLQRQLMEVTKQAPSNNKASLRERVKRQHALTKQASKLMKKIDGLGEGDKAKAHELWEELERVEGQLRQTFGQAQTSLIPGQPAAGWMVVSSVQAPGAPVQLPGALLNPAARHGAGAPIIVAPPGGGFGTARVLNVAPGAAQPDVHAELQALRRQVEELRAQMQRLSEKK